MTESDFLIIGSGVAGLNIALRLSEIGNVILATKTLVKKSNSYLAQGGIAAVCTSNDRARDHFEDTFLAGAKHGDKKAIRYLVNNACKAIRRLEDFGIRFEKKLTMEGGHSTPRIYHTMDFTGKSIVETLFDQVRQNHRITVMENTVALNLITSENNCYGAVFHNTQTKKTYPVYTQNVVLASGGCGQVFKKTSNPLNTTGDGLAIAARSGAKMKDMEFIQFHPTGLDINTNPYFLLSETMRGEGAILRNSAGEAFMKKYHEKGNLAPRDIVSKSIFQESKNGRVFLDFTDKKEHFLHKRFPSIDAHLKEKGLNLAHDLIPIIPLAHYLCGGIKVNLQGKTNIQNLYALGEVACTGVHGANRLASNSLLEALVFAEPLYEYIKQHFSSKQQDYESIIEEKDIKPVYFPKNKKIQETIKDIMWKKVGIVRNEGSLREADAMLSKIEEPEDYETKNLLTVSRLITKTARKRKKSLGCHYLES